MRRMTALVIVMGLIGGAFGALAYGELARPASAVPPPQPMNITGPLDIAGNVKVHEQGTANVNVTNSTLSVSESPGRIISFTPPADIAPGAFGLASPQGGGSADTSDCRSLTLFIDWQGIVPHEVSLMAGGSSVGVHGTSIDAPADSIFAFLVPSTSLPVTVPSVSQVAVHNLDGSASLHLFSVYLYCAH